MQCARCNIGSVERATPRSRFNRAKFTYMNGPRLLEPYHTDESVDDSWAAENGDLADFESGTFVQDYKPLLIICSVVALFCGSALFYLSYSVLNLGILAVPFLAIFAAGLVLSIGLPFKLRKEHAIISRG